MADLFQQEHRQPQHFPPREKQKEEGLHHQFLKQAFLRRSSPLFYDNFLIRMILVIIRTKDLSEKRIELSQIIVSLSGSIRMENGCQRCDLCQSIEDESQLFSNLL